MKTLLYATLSLLLLTLPALADSAVDSTEIRVPAWAAKPATPPVFAWPEVQVRHANAPADEPAFAVSAAAGDAASAIEELVGPGIQALGGSIEESAGALRVKGSEEARATARQQIEALCRFLLGRTRIRVQLVAWPEAERPERIEAVTRALRDGRARLEWTSSFELRRGEGGIRETLEDRTFLHSLEPEVAQQAALVEPRVATLRTGRRLYVACRPTTAGWSLATLSLGLSREIPPLRTVVAAPGTLDLPKAAFLSLTTSIRLKAKNPELVLLDHPFEDGGLLLVVTLLESPPPTALPFELVDLTAVTGHPDVLTAAEQLPVGLRRWDQGRRRGYERDDYHRGTEDLRALREATLRERLEQVDDSVSLIELAPSVVAVVGSKNARARVREILERESSHGRFRREGFRTAWAALPAAPYFDPLRGTIRADRLRAEGGPRPTGLLDLPTAAGTPGLLIHGTWERVLTGFDSEIAQGAVVVRPYAGSHVGGEALLLRPDPFRGWKAPRLGRATSRLLERETRDLTVLLDVDGKRSAVPRHPLDMTRVAKTSTELVLQEAVTTDVFRSGDEARIHVWSK